MRELKVEGVTDDGRHLLARDLRSGEQFHIAADHQLARFTRDTVVPGRPEKAMTISLSPREIQTRIRHGATAEELAETSDMPLARVMAFAAPVLAEREHKAGRARESMVRRRYADGPISLDDALRAHLPNNRVEDAAWDAWLRNDGKWNVTVQFPGAPDPVHFLYDEPGRYVIAADSAASELIGDTLNRPTDDMKLAQAVAARLEADAELSADFDASDPSPEAAELSPEAPELSPGATEPAVTDALRAEELSDSAPPAPTPVAHDPNHDEPPAGVASLKRARDRRAMEQLSLGYEDAAEPDATPEPEPPAAPSEAELPDEPEQSEAERPKKKERRRVPSWDEIMFGNNSS